MKDLTYRAANEAAQDPLLRRPVMEAAWADQQQDYVRAAAACEEALRLKPDNAHLHALRPITGFYREMNGKPVMN